MKKLLVSLAIVVIAASAQAKRIPEYDTIGSAASGDYLLLSDTSASGKEYKVALSALLSAIGAQGADADLTTWAGVTSSANGRSLVSAANYAAMRGLLDLEVGVDVAAVLGEDDNYVTDAEKTILGNTSGTNTGDQASSGVAFTPDGTIEATDAQTAIEEVRDEAQPLLGQAAAGGFYLVEQSELGVQGIGVPGTWRMFYTDAAGGVENFSIGTVGHVLTSGGTGGPPTWTDPATFGGGGGYTDITSFDAQTAWRIFYSDGSGDVTELALGSDGEYLKSNGASAAPSWATPSGAAHDAVTLSTDAGNNLLGLSTQQITLDSQTANYIFAAPNGSSGAPSFRAMADGDIPSAIARDTEIPTDATITTTDVTTNDASTSKHGWLLKATAPASGLRNVVAIDNGETAYKNAALFDATSPTTQAYGDSAAVGTAMVAARRDHKHAMPAAVTDATISTSDVTTSNASTSKHGWESKATAPASGLRNIYAIDNGETARTDKALFDATAPSTQASGDSAVVGTAMTAARRDHKHAMPTIPTVSNTAYDATSWNGNSDAATKDAIRDHLESKLPSGSDGTYGLTLQNNTSRTPTAASYELYVDNGVWKMNTNGTEATIPTSASGITDIVQDTTPQLGGNLDLNGHTITGLVIGTNVQAYDADLTTWAGVTPGTWVGTLLGTPTSANLRAALTDEVGTGAAYFVGGALGTPASATGTNFTGLPKLSSTAYGATTSAELSGVLSDENANGGYMTNPMTTAGDMIKGGTSGATTRMVPGTGVVTALEAAANGSGGFVTVGNAAGASAVLTGYSSGAGTVAATDTILQAINKLNGNTAAKANSADPVFTSSTQLPNGANPTTDAAGEIAVDSSTGAGQGIRAYGAVAFTVPAYQTKCTTINAATSSSDFMVETLPYAITIRAAHVNQIGATNVVGHFDECDSAGANCATIDSTADITATSSKANDDGTLSNPSIDAGDVISWHTTSVSGTNTQLMVCFDYTVDQVN